MPRLYPIPVVGSRADPGRWRHAYIDPARSGVQFWDAVRLGDLVTPDPPGYGTDRGQR